MAALRIGIVAGEHSGDNLGAAFMREVLARAPETTFTGIAGPRMRAAGCTVLADAEELAVMGLFEVLRHLPRLLRLRRCVVEAFLKAPPDVFVGIDAPEFNLNVAPRLHAAGIPTVQYVSPQVWAWRQGRVKKMARSLDEVLCLLPFETPFYSGHGLPATFVGHPLADQLPLQPDRAAARAALGLPAVGPVVAVLPGSRRGEVERLAPVFAEACSWLRTHLPLVECVAPMASSATRELFSNAWSAAHAGPVKLLDGQAQLAMTAADVVLVASGTATLEATLCKRPMVVAYRLSGATAATFRLLGLMKAPYFAQPNLLAGEGVVPELFQEAANGPQLGQALLDWFEQPARVAALEERFLGIHQQLRRDASARAAEAVLAVAARKRGAVPTPGGADAGGAR